MALYIKDYWSYEGFMTQPQFSRAQLSSISRVPEGALTFWLRRALIRPANEVSGKGNHRRFSLTDVKLAAFLREAHRAGMNIAAMEALVREFRRADELISPLPHHLKGFHDAVHDDRTSGYERIAAMLKGGIITESEAGRLRHVADEYPRHRLDEIWVWSNFRDAEGLWVASLDDADHWTLSYRIGQERLTTSCAIVFDCARIFGEVHRTIREGGDGAQVGQVARG